MGVTELSATKRKPKRTLWTLADKVRIVEETLVAGASVSVVARRHDVNANQVFGWRRQYRNGQLCGGKRSRSALIPVGVIGVGAVGAVAEIPASAQRQVPAASLETPFAPSPLSVSSPVRPRMIEVELKGGTKLRIDADMKGSALQQVLKLIRGLA